ncbi:hypothetical protein A8W25_23400 [Streptomyces sp. ERV7]|uniref:hypothetical protein n=1 Tax=Streptomyces sp. ERV7 TaxID=1322334 RepID=UPI0007F440AF|nr:hypothetical protein [Streptomyces sp. ERV7]OAR22567.1 hypothetical protein A8W25_23400 [Streptomyces sp. ERV7]
MNPVVLACVVLPVTAVLYGLIGLRRRTEHRWYRAAVAHCAAIELDPYHAVADRWWPEDDTQAAAAQLVLDGLVTVNRRGNLSLTAAGADPARDAGHPLPHALLAALRRRSAPATLGNVLLRDPQFHTVRTEFHADCAARLLPQRPAPPSDLGCLGCTGVALLLGQFGFAATGLFDRMPHGTAQWAAAVATGAALLAQITGLCGVRVPDELPDPFAEWLARPGSPHPALAELAVRDPEAEAWLRAGRFRTRRGRNRGRPRRRGAPAEAGA